MVIRYLIRTKAIRWLINSLLTIVFAIGFLFPAYAYASTAPILQVAVVYNKSQKIIARYIQNSLYHFPKPYPKLHLYELSEFSQLSVTDMPFDLIISLGPSATSYVLRSDIRLPVLSALVRQQYYLKLIGNLALDENFNPQRVSAIFLDQPVIRQVRLVKYVLSEMPKHSKSPTSRDVGLLLGASNAFWQDKWHDAATLVDLPLNIVLLNRKDSPMAALNFLLQNSKGIILFPDNSIFNRHTALGILLSAYNRQVPLFGYSRKYVRLGALAAVYSHGKQVANQVVQTLLTLKIDPKTKTIKMPELQYSKSFSVAVNYQVAKSLGIVVKSEAEIKKQMLLDEQGQVNDWRCHMPSNAVRQHKGKS